MPSSNLGDDRGAAMIPVCGTARQQPRLLPAPCAFTIAPKAGRNTCVRAARTSAEADAQSEEDRLCRHRRRYARFLRLLPDRLCARLYCRALALDLRAVGDRPAVLGS